MSRRRRLLIALGALALLWVGFITVVTLLFGRPSMVRVQSCSMAPSLQAGDRVVLRGRTGTIERGHIVVYRRPDGGVEAIARVVAVGGDTIEGRDRRVHVNGSPAREPYLREGTLTLDFGPVAVPPGSYFLMGDNRPNASDSRTFGPLPRSEIVGRRLWVLGNSNDCSG